MNTVDRTEEPGVCERCGWPAQACSCDEGDADPSFADVLKERGERYADRWNEWADSIMEQIGDD